MISRLSVKTFQSISKYTRIGAIFHKSFWKKKKKKPQHILHNHQIVDNKFLNKKKDFYLLHNQIYENHSTQKDKRLREKLWSPFAFWYLVIQVQFFLKFDLTN